MLNLIPRCLQPRETVVKKGSIVRLKYLRGRRAVIIAGKSALRLSGKLNDIIGHLTSAGLDVTLMDPVEREPVAGLIQGYADKLESLKPDWIIACGGGSVIDTAKLSWALYENPNSKLEDFYKPFSMQESVPKAKVIAIPTTSGSGSEMSTIGVVTDSVSKKKIPINSPTLMPEMVILDASLTSTLPPQTTVATALDALTHAFEAYCSSASHAWTDLQALPVGRLIYENLENALEKPEDLQVREKLLYAAAQAGYAQSIAYVGAAHAFAHTLGAQIGVNHGLACGLFLPRVAIVNSKFTPKAEKFAIESGFQSVSQFADWIYSMLKAVDFPKSWQETVGKGQTFDQREMIKAAMADPCMRTAPKKLTLEQWTKVLEKEPSCIAMSF